MLGVRDCKGYTPLDIAVKEMHVRTLQAYHKGNMLSIIVKMLHAAVCLKNNPVVQSCPMRIYNEVMSAYKHHNANRQRF